MTQNPASTVYQIDGHGDGEQLDTAAVQDAIDHCHAAGGGMVVCPPGIYRIGTIELKSNVRLHLTAGATLKGSTQREDYRTIWTGIEEREFLVYAEKADNIAITGQGAIDGTGTHFFEPIPGNERMKVRDWRPYHMLTFLHCRDVLIRDVTLLDSPCYSIWPLGCERLRITGIKIIANRWGPNTDGIDPDCCCDVIISDCSIDCGDDCIALKSDTAKYGGMAPCENVTVTNCTMRTTTCGIRIGYEGDGPIRNCTFSNIVMHDTRTGINMLVPREVGRPMFMIEHGPAIENIHFSNMLLDTQIAFYFWIGDDAARPGCIRNVNISDITATTEEGCHISGARDNAIENLRMNNVRLTMRNSPLPPMDDPLPYPFPVFGHWPQHGLPHAWFFRHVHGLSVSGMQVDWREAGDGWRSTIRVDDCMDVGLHNLHVQGLPPQSDTPVLDFVNVRDASVRAARSEATETQFLRQSDSIVKVVGD
jgi:hypothetical protein